VTAEEGAIRFEDVRFRYATGTFELRVDALEVRQAEQVAVIGPSGSGKTTLLHLAAGIAAPSRGQVRTREADLAALGEDARRDFRIRTVGLVFQELELIDYLSVLDNILLPYRIAASLRLDAAVRQRAEALAERVGLADKLGRLVPRLSHGERQRVAVCRALVTRPPLVLADEPTAGLDPSNKLVVLDILLDHVREQGATLLAVTHDHELLSRFERVIDVKSLAGSAA
jgi:putative ABC transport system ATP-binding protein